MISDLIPNIANDSKVAVEAQKGLSKANEGVFSLLLKNFEQEVSASGESGHQCLPTQTDGEKTPQVNQSENQQTTHSGDDSDQQKLSTSADDTSINIEQQLVVEESDIEVEEKELATNQLYPIENRSATVPQGNAGQKEEIIAEFSEPDSDITAKLPEESRKLKGNDVLGVHAIQNPQVVGLQVENENVESENHDTLQKGKNLVISETVIASEMEHDEDIPAIESKSGNSNKIATALDHEQSNLSANSVNTKSTDTAIVDAAGEIEQSEIKSLGAAIESADGLFRANKEVSNPTVKSESEANKEVPNSLQTEGATARKEPQTTHNAQLKLDTEAQPLSLQRIRIAQKNDTIASLSNLKTTGINEQIATEKNVHPSSFNTAQSSEILQVIQQNKAITKVSKEVKSHRFALSNTEQEETRLKLLVDSVRPEILSNRELPVELTSTTEVKFSDLFSATGTLSNEQELMLKEMMMETTSSKEAKNSDANNFGFIRLNELAVLNTSARRSIVSSFGQALQKNVKSDQAYQTEQWQKHSFKLEEGNSIDLTTKNIDGVLHIKLAASNPELNRLLQNMEQEIKDHLKEELNLELDLQFNQSSDENDSESIQKGILSEKAKIAAKQARELQQAQSEKTNSGFHSSIRSFGYNQMEWTA